MIFVSIRHQCVLDNIPKHNHNQAALFKMSLDKVNNSIGQNEYFLINCVIFF